MNFSELISREALQFRIHSTIRLLHNGIKHIHEAPAGDARADKAACEIALLFWGLNRHGYFSAGSNSSIQDLLNLTEQRLRSEAVMQGFLWKPSRVSMLCIGTALLNGLGRHNKKFDNVARAAWRKLFLDSSELSPFQLLEVEWSSQLLGVNITLNIPKDSLLFRKSSPLMMNAEDGYAFTHSVFYATNFGRQQLPPAIVRNEIWGTIESGIIWSLLRFDFDLLGEFLLTAFYSQMTYTPILYIGLSALFLTWDDNGFVPDRELNASELTSSGIFYGIYHANIVAALLSGELMNSKIFFDRNAIPQFVSTFPCEMLHAKCYSKLSVFESNKTEVRHKFISAVALLENILGRKVTKNLESILGEVTLSHAYPDLLIGYGLIFQDVEAVLMGARKSFDKKSMSSVMACAVEWLGMASEIHKLVRNSGDDGIVYSGPAGPFKQKGTVSEHSPFNR
jgi:hypothetical protein